MAEGGEPIDEKKIQHTLVFRNDFICVVVGLFLPPLIAATGNADGAGGERTAFRCTSRAR